MPLEERHVQRSRYFFGEQGFAGARFALDEQGALQGDGGVDRQGQVAGGDVGFGAFEFHGWAFVKRSELRLIVRRKPLSELSRHDA